MKDFVIVTDNMTDLPASYYQEHDLVRICLTYMMDGVTYTDDEPMPTDRFYAAMRSGKMPTTSQVNPQRAKECFEAVLQETKQILCITVSSGISGTYSSMMTGAREAMEEHPEAKIVVIDSLCASLGEGLLTHKAVTMRDQGKSFEEICEWMEAHKLNVVHNFTVDDLFHLHRGGRVSKAAAIAGTLIQVKPLLHVDDEGHLTVVGKVRGRKRSIEALSDAVGKQIGEWMEPEAEIFISHADCEEDARRLEKLIREKYGLNRFLISSVGPTIGSHSGPGTLALFYMGEKR